MEKTKTLEIMNEITKMPTKEMGEIYHWLGEYYMNRLMLDIEELEIKIMEAS